MFCLQEEIAHQAQHVLTAELHLSKCSGSVKDAVQMQLTQLRAVQHGVPLLEPAFARGTQFLQNVHNCLYGHLNLSSLVLMHAMWRHMCSVVGVAACQMQLTCSCKCHSLLHNAAVAKQYNGPSAPRVGKHSPLQDHSFT